MNVDSRPISLHGFNEAEAMKPRMPLRLYPVHSAPHSFNEAEAMKPRMPVERGLVGNVGLAASMRPRR